MDKLMARDQTHARISDRSCALNQKTNITNNITKHPNNTRALTYINN